MLAGDGLGVGANGDIEEEPLVFEPEPLAVDGDVGVVVTLDFGDFGAAATAKD